MGGAIQTGENRGSVMGVTDATYDNAVDVTYSTKPDNTVTNLNAITTSTTAQPLQTTRILKPIINNTVRPPIVSNTVVNPMVNNILEFAQKSSYLFTVREYFRARPLQHL